MLDEEIMLLIVPVVIFVVAGVVSFFLGKSRKPAALWAYAILWGALTAALFVGLVKATGFDGIIYIIGLALLSAPSGLGYMIGAPIGWVNGKKRIDA